MLNRLALFIFCATNTLCHGLHMRSVFCEIAYKVIHKGLRGNFCPFLGGVKFRVVIPPVVVVLLADLTSSQHSCGLTSSAEHLVQLGSITILSYIDLETDLSVHLVNIQTIAIFQCEQRVHQANIGVYIRYRKSICCETNEFFH